MSNHLEDYTQSVEEMKEEWWQNRYREWYDSGAYFSQSIKPLERRKYQAWIKRIGAEAKKKGNKALVMLAYAVIKDYEIYPDPNVDVVEYWK